MLAIRRNTKSVRWSTVAVKSLLGLSVVSASVLGSPTVADEKASEVPVAAYLQSAQFKIPFSVESRSDQPLQVQLWVSTDDGTTWHPHGSVTPDSKHFEFRAAAEGVYLFKVVTIDVTGTMIPSAAPPLKVLVDTSKPQAEIQADIDGEGKLLVDVRVVDEHLDFETARLRIRSDHESQWRELPITLTQVGSYFAGKAFVDLAPCREVAVVFTIKDRAQNEGEASIQYSVPRTAAAESDMTLASTRQPKGLPAVGASNTSAPQAPWQAGPTPGATRWNPTTVMQPQSEGTSAVAVRPNLSSPGKFVAQSTLALDGPAEQPEELPPPLAFSREHSVATETRSPQSPEKLELTEGPQDAEASAHKSEDILTIQSESRLEPATTGRAFHCKSRAFSLDYSVEALGGGALAEVELWGTEDAGSTWQKWGADPDRISPFDVQVGNDGTFGFRMVIVGTNGVVSNRPRKGDSPDVWINIDTNQPNIKITRAVYGEGPEDGLLVIDYTCEDEHLAERPINLFYSERVDGPWTLVASGLANTGIYLWRAAPSLPNKIFLKVEAVDKAGNLGVHRLDLPIDIKGLAPRGIIQGFRAIEVPK